MKVVVQKYGGTSVASEENREKVAMKIIEKYNQGYRPVIVVSAIGRKGDPYATDSLIELIDSMSLGKRELDLIMSCGEVISAVVLSNLLTKKGYACTVLTGSQAGINTDTHFGNADIINIDPSKIIENLSSNKIVIIPGFQGVTKNGDITTLGRGGSDTSAVAIAEALNCNLVEIYTDVDGIMTADPRIVKEARLIKNMCYSEVYQLAEDGAKVIHPRAIDIAQRSNIEVKIKNTLNECVGTLINSKELGKNNNLYNKGYNELISAITYKKHRAQITIETSSSDLHFYKLLDNITNHKISIDLINFFTDKKVFTVDENDIITLDEILKNSGYNYNTIMGCCKISLIGNRMRGIPGVMLRIVRALTLKKINILQSSDSHTTIWCLIKQQDTEAAINALHEEFCLHLE